MSAAAEMVRRYERGVRYALLRLIHNPADRDDLVQDVWIVALTRIQRGELREPDRLFAFLIGTANGLAVNERRRFKRRATVHDSAAIDEYPDGGDEPIEVIECEQCRQLARDAIRTMRVQHYRDVLLGALANEDSSTTCAALGMNPNEHRRILFKAKNRLRKVVRETTTPPWPPRRASHHP
jgi:RNA polymerase sigma factor (sigma-70 family)